MPIMRTLNRVLDPIKTKMRNIVSRGVLQSTNDKTKWQSAKVSLLNGEMIENVERAQEYGFTSRPLNGSEVLVVSVGGSRSHSIIIACDNRDHRMGDCEPGEVKIYTHEGDYIHFKENNEIEIKTKKLTIKAEDEINIETEKFTLEAEETDLGGSTQLNLNTPSLGMSDGKGGKTKAELSGDFKQDGSHTSTGDQVASGISQVEHTHDNVQAGNSQTGKPVK